MTDLPLFPLDSAGRWRLAYDSNQWVIQCRRRAPRPSNSAGISDSGWRGVSFIGSGKRVLRRCLSEKGVILTPAALANLDALPEQFLAFIAAPDSNSFRIRAVA